MDGWTYAYLEFAGQPTVGAALLDARPAFVFAADGSRLLWANPAACRFLGERTMGELLARIFSDLDPIKAQAARLCRVLPSGTARLEILTFDRGPALASLPAACRRLTLPGNTRALLAVAGSPVDRPLAARGHQAIDVLRSAGQAIAIVTPDGDAIAAGGGGASSRAIAGEARTVVAAARSDQRWFKARSKSGRQAAAALFSSDQGDLYLVAIDAEVAGDQAEDATDEFAEPLIDETPLEAMFPEEVELDEPFREPAPTQQPEPVPQPPEAEVTRVEELSRGLPIETSPVRRFAWEIGSNGAFTLATAELAEAVGEANAAVHGLAWRDIAKGLGLDPDHAIADALDRGRRFTATVYWPDASADDAVAIELTGLSEPGDHGGYRGFGLIRADDRRPDTRSDKSGLAKVPKPSRVAPEPHAAEPPPKRPEPPEHRVDLDGAARRSIEEGTLPRVAAGPAREDARSNVVRLPAAERSHGVPETLTGIEREAFRRIAEVLKTPAGDADSDRDESHEPPGSSRKASREVQPDFDARLLDRLPVGIVIFRDRRTLFANRTLVEMLRYDTYEAFIAAGGAEALFPGADDIAANIAEAGGNVAAVRGDGRAVTVAARLHAVPFAGATALMLTLSEAPGDSDIAVARLESRANELEAILDTATDGVIVVDVRGKIDSLNRAAEALFGVNGPEYVGRYFTDLLADESQKPALDYLDGLAANGVASVLNDGREVIGRVPQGGLIPLFMTMGRIAGTDKFCAVIRDITHWKNVEEELVAARRTAEAANQQKSDFLAKISHEIRTPLNAIIGFSEVMMEERFGSIGNPRYRDYLRDIHVSGAHLMSLINDLLDISKIEAGKLDLSFESVAINAGIQECVALMQPQANRERIIIRTSLASELPNVVADPRSLRQILLNLLSNAIKFTRAGGQVIVATSLEDSGEVTMRIRDTGIGMSAKDIETALKPFRQVALSRDDRDHGTGLGLPLTKALVEANRASFAIESSPNQGTLVKVTFPTTRVLAG